MKKANRICAVVSALLVVGASWQIGQEWQGPPKARIGSGSPDERGVVPMPRGDGIVGATWTLPDAAPLPPHGGAMRPVAANAPPLPQPPSTPFPRVIPMPSPRVGAHTPSRVVSAVFLPDGETMATGNFPGFWGQKTRSQPGPQNPANENRPHSVVQLRAAHTSDVSPPSVPFPSNSAHDANGPVFLQSSPNGAFLAAGSHRGDALVIYSVRAQKNGEKQLQLVWSRLLNPKQPDASIYRPVGFVGTQFLYLSQTQKQTRLHFADSPTGRPQRTQPLTLPSGKLIRLVLSRDNTTLVGAVRTGDTQATLVRVSVATGKVLQTATTIPVSDMAVSPNGKTVATLHPNGEARFWGTNLAPLPGVGKASNGDIAPRREVATGHWLVFAPNSQTVAGFSRGRIVVWDIASGKPPRVAFKIPVSPLYTDLAFSPDGTTLAVASALPRVVLLPLRF